jgi:DNA-binding transcriptional LysR family regulator
LIYTLCMFDLWSLQVLVAVADRGSFSGAAKSLNLTQPAVSRQIAALERRFGVTLFRRLPRGVRATHAGEVAIDQAGAILGRVSDMEARLKALAGLEGARVRVSAFPSAHTSLVPEVIGRFTRRYPGVEVSLVDVPSGEAIRAVRAGEVDVALVTGWDHPHPRSGDGVEILSLVEDRLFIALPRGHRLARRRPLRLPDLRDETWIEGAHPDCLGPLEDLGRAIGVPTRIGYVCDDWNGKQALVAEGLGIMVFPALALASARRDVVLQSPSPKLPPRRVYVAVAEDRYRAPAVSEMLVVLLAAARETQRGSLSPRRKKASQRPD